MFYRLDWLHDSWNLEEVFRECTGTVAQYEHSNAGA